MFYANLKKSTIAVALCLSFTMSGQDQARIDSLQLSINAESDDLTLSKLLDQLYIENRSSSPEILKSILDKELLHAKASKDSKAVIYARFNEAQYYYRIQEYNKSLEIVDAIESSTRALNDPLKLSAMLSFRSGIFGLKGDYLEGLKDAQESIDLGQKHGAPINNIAFSYFDMANIYGSTDKYEESTKYYKEAQRMFMKAKNKKWANRMHMYIGLDAQQTQRFELAKQSFKACILGAIELNDPRFVLKSKGNLGSLEQELGNLQIAKDYYIECLKMAEEDGNIYVLNEMYQRNAHISVDLKDYKSALGYIKKSLPLSLKMGDKDAQRRDYEYLSKSYAATGNHQKAYDYLLKYNIVNDSLQGAHRLSAIDELSTKFETAQKENEINLLEEKDRSNGIIKKGLIAGIVSLLAIFGLIYYSLKQRIYANRAEKEKLDQELSFKEIELNSKKKELTAYALQLVSKNGLLEELKLNVKELTDQKGDQNSIQKILNTISINQNDNQTWESFRARFLEVHSDFESNVRSKYKNITASELRFITLVKMNLSSKEIANMLNISSEGIKKARYRVRKKLNLQPTESLEELISSL